MESVNKPGLQILSLVINFTTAALLEFPALSLFHQDCHAFSYLEEGSLYSLSLPSLSVKEINTDFLN